eukprot:scaffold216442_cov31-Tisochrysis_lutea.AAC.2
MHGRRLPACAQITHWVDRLRRAKARSEAFCWPVRQIRKQFGQKPCDRHTRSVAGRLGALELIEHLVQTSLFALVCLHP